MEALPFINMYIERVTIETIKNIESKVVIERLTPKYENTILRI